MTTTTTAEKITNATTTELRRMYMAEIAGEQNANALSSEWPENGMTDAELRAYLIGHRN